MTLLIAGVLLWSLVHLLPIAARGLRQRLVSRLGLGAYSGPVCPDHTTSGCLDCAGLDVSVCNRGL
jgi:hypothetical protein